LFALIATAIKLDSRGPVFFRQTRVGQDGRHFTMLKFRSMVEGAHSGRVELAARSEGRGLFKLREDPRVTRVGRVLRGTSLDELPQLLNVLRGDMSLVGPRPCIPYETESFAPYHFERFLVPAGVTGLWQVTARASSTFREALDMDVSYARGWSLGLDVRLLFRTPFQVLRQRRSTA
jgi:lipopolysaccharide/colanic/teichoic acid biosynthesis glycosyltransferase